MAKSTLNGVSRFSNTALAQAEQDYKQGQLAIVKDDSKTKEQKIAAVDAFRAKWKKVFDTHRMLRRAWLSAAGIINAIELGQGGTSNLMVMVRELLKAQSNLTEAMKAVGAMQ